MQLHQVVDNLNNQVVHCGKLSRNQVHNQVAKEYQVVVSTNLKQTANSSRVKVHKQQVSAVKYQINSTLSLSLPVRQNAGH